MKKLIIFIMFILFSSFAFGGFGNSLDDNLIMAVTFNVAVEDDLGIYTLGDVGTASGAGVNSNGRYFDGGTDHITMDWSNSVEGTVSMWLDPDNEMGTGYEGFLTYDNLTAGCYFIMSNYVGEIAEYGVYNNPTTDYLQPADAFPAGYFNVIYRWNSTGHGVLYEGAEVAGSAKNGVFCNGTYPFLGGWAEDGGLYAPYAGKMDEVYIWNRHLTNAEIATLQTDFYTSASTPTPVYEFPTPPDATINNTLAIINVSCTGAYNVSLWFDDNADPITLALDNVPSPANYTTVPILNDTHYYKASCDAGVTVNTSVRSWVYDSSPTNINLESNNVFTTNNDSTGIYTANKILNITFTDNRDLFAMLINITYANYTLFNITNESLSGTSYNYGTILTGVPKNTLFNVTVSVADSHTDETIKDYKPEATYKKLKYKTEFNNIQIETEDGAFTYTKKSKDRYNFTFEFEDGLTKDRVFYIKADNPILYRPNSPYQAHFIIGTARGGNWVDFVTAGYTPIVEKIKETEFKITFLNLPPLITFNSIGGLNSRTEYYQFYSGNYTQTQSPDPVFSGVAGEIVLNISYGGTIDNINATIWYDGTENASLTKTDNGNHFLFSYPATPVNTNQNLNVSYYWTVNVSQTGGGDVQFNTSTENYRVNTWFIDDCSNANATAFVFNIRDELTNTLIDTNISAQIQYYLTSAPASIKTYSESLNLSNGYIRFCKSPDNGTFIGDINFIMSGTGYNSRTYYDYAGGLNETLTGYLLPIASNTQEVTFKIVDSALSAIEGADMTIYRYINTSLTPVYHKITDISGQAETYLSNLYSYYFIISATGYPTKTFNLQPIETTYTIKLEGDDTSFYDNLYAGLRYKIEPAGTLFNVSNTWVNFTFTVEGQGMTEIGINYTNHNYACLPASCSQVLATTTGGVVTLSLFLNETGNFNMAYWFTTPTGNRVYVNDDLGKVTPFIFQGINSLMDLVQDVKDNTSPMVITVLAVSAQMVGIGLGAVMGLSGTILIIPAVFVTIALGAVGLLHPIVAGLLAFFGVVMFVSFNMRGNQ